MPAERAEGASLCRGCGSSSRLPRLLLLLSASRPPAPDWTLLLRLCEDKKADIGRKEGEGRGWKDVARGGQYDIHDSMSVVLPTYDTLRKEKS